MLSDAVYRVRRNDLTDTRHRSFIIDTYRSMLLCFVDFVVHGSLDAVISLVEDAEDFVTDSFQEIREALQSAVEGVNSALEATVDNTINIIPGCVACYVAKCVADSGAPVWTLTRRQWTCRSCRPSTT